MRFVQQVADSGGAVRAQGLNGVEHALVFGDDVAHPAKGFFVENLASTGEVVDAEVPEGCDAHCRCPGLAGCPAVGVTPGGVGVLHSGVDDDEFETSLGKAEFDDLSL